MVIVIIIIRERETKAARSTVFITTQLEPHRHERKIQRQFMCGFYKIDDNKSNGIEPIYIDTLVMTHHFFLVWVEG